MKALKSISFFFLLLTFVFSCSHFGSTGRRAPASVTQEGSCNGTMRYLLLKRKRSQKITSMIKAGDIDGLKNMFWSSHLVEREGVKQPYSRFYRQLRRLNQSTHVPALFQTKNKYVGDTDTFSTIIKIVDDSVEVDDEEAKALEDVLGWINYVSGYKERFETAIERGSETKIILDNLENRLARKGDLRKADFPQRVEVPVVNGQGQVEKSEIFFESKDDLLDYVKDKRREVRLTWAQNFVDEYYQKSKLYNVMIDQALFVRRLQLIQERLNNIPVAKLSEDQKTLKELIEEVLADPKNQPRKDVMKAVRDKEFWTEFWATLKFWKSKRVENDAKYTLPKTVLEKAKAVSPYGVMVRSAAVLTLATGAILTPVTIIYDDNPWVMYVTSLISNYFNDFLVNDLDLPSGPLSRCYKAERSWNVEEESTMNKFVESHLSRYTAYQRIEPSYDPNKDPEYVKKKLELQALCAKMRLEYKAATRHVENKELLNNHGYRFAVHMVLIELLKDHPKSSELTPLLYEYFEVSELYNDKEKAAKLEASLSQLAGTKFVRQLKQYQQDVAGALPRVKAGDFPIYYPSTDEFFESVQKYKSE